MDKNKLWFVLILAVITGWILYSVVVIPHIVPWDEAGYVIGGNSVYQALKKADPVQFLAVTRQQFYYPFLQSWLLAFFGLIFGFSITTARLASLALLIPSVMLIFAIGEKLKKRAGFYASLLFLTSPLSLFFFGSAFKEALGLFLGLLVFYLYGRRNLVLAGIVLTLLTLTKYNYGVLPGIILGLESLWELFRERRRFGVWLKDQLLLFGIPVLVMGWWILTPDNKISWFIKILRNPFTPSAGETGLFGHLTYYLFELASSYTFSQVFFAAVLISFFLGLRRFFKDKMVRVLSLFFLANFILGTFHFGNQQSRFIYTSIFGFFIIAGTGFDDLVLRLKKLAGNPYLRGFIGVVVFVFSLYSFRDLLLAPKMFRPTLAHGQGYPLFYETDFTETRYNYDKSTWPHQYPAQKETVEDIFDYIFAQIDVRKPVRQIGRTNEINPLFFDLLLSFERQRQVFRSDQFSGYVVTIKILPGSLFDSRDYRLFNQWQQMEVDRSTEDTHLRKIAAKAFSQLGVVVTIYGE